MARLENNGLLFEKNLGQLGLSVKFIKGVESPLGDTYYYDLINIMQYNKKYLQSLVEKLSLVYHLDMKLTDSKETHFALFVAQKQVKLSLAQCLREVNQREIVIGKDENGELVKLDFEKIPHLLIAGTTGSGKSVLLHNILVNLLSYYGVAREENRFRKGVEFIIIDPKGNELDMYQNVKNTTFVSETSRAIGILEKVVAEMDRRYRENITPTSDLFIIIDELADLMLTSKFEVESSIVRLAQKGRALGIHLIVATQRPTVDVCSGLIKANMPYRIALKTASVRDSVVILDHKGSEQLQGCGDCIVKLGLHEYHTQVAYPEDELESKFIMVNRG